MAGIVVVAIALVTSIFGTALYVKRRNSNSTSTTKSTPTSSPTTSDAPISRSRLPAGRKRRAQDSHGRYPSLENGPGPTIVKKMRRPMGLDSRNFVNKSNSSVRDGPTLPSKSTLNSPTATVGVPEGTTTKDTPTEVMSTSPTASTRTTALDTEQSNMASPDRPSSLHQAVLKAYGQDTDIGNEGARVGGGRETKAEDQSNDSKTDAKTRPRGYTGAWP